MPRLLPRLHHRHRVFVLVVARPIVALNRAVAAGMAQGPAAGLEALDAAATLAGDGALAGYNLFPSVRGDLLIKMGRITEARKEIEQRHRNDEEPAGTGIAGEQVEAVGEGGLLRIGAVLSFETPLATSTQSRANHSSASP